MCMQTYRLCKPLHFPKGSVFLISIGEKTSLDVKGLMTVIARTYPSGKMLNQCVGNAK